MHGFFFVGGQGWDSTSMVARYRRDACWRAGTVVGRGKSAGAVGKSDLAPRMKSVRCLALALVLLPGAGRGWAAAASNPDPGGGGRGGGKFSCRSAGPGNSPPDE